ncbi:MAG TPA: response regulator [Verrucomicrobiota bacterium]|nr:response regulator [Verrucomicrobiota bacterium]
MNPDASHLPQVLLVEDDADLRAYLRGHLEPQYRVLESSRGDEGLTMARAEMPDLIVADILMPGLDGFELCRAIKSEGKTDFIPLILLTAKSDAPSRLQGLEGGADDYLAKPFDPAELLLRIRNLLRARARLIHRFAPAAGLQPTPLSVPPRETGFVDRVRAVLDRRSQEESFDTAALAAQLRLSRSHLHRCVTRAFGVAPSELIVRFRLERAAGMLRRQAGSVGEIAHAVGFRDLSHFGRRFRLHFGRTPAAYAAGRPAETTARAGT